MSLHWTSMFVASLVQAMAFDWLLQAGALRAGGADWYFQFVGGVVLSMLAQKIWKSGEGK